MRHTVLQSWSRTQSDYMPISLPPAPSSWPSSTLLLPDGTSVGTSDGRGGPPGGGNGGCRLVPKHASIGRGGPPGGGGGGFRSAGGFLRPPRAGLLSCRNLARTSVASLALSMASRSCEDEAQEHTQHMVRKERQSGVCECSRERGGVGSECGSSKKQNRNRVEIQSRSQMERRGACTRRVSPAMGSLKKASLNMSCVPLSRLSQSVSMPPARRSSCTSVG